MKSVTYYCDICHRPLNDRSSWSRYKLMKEEHSWHESYWAKLDVHDDCWHQLCQEIADKATETNRDK